MKEKFLTMNFNEMPGIELKINSRTSVLTIPFDSDNIRVFKYNTDRFQYFPDDVAFHDLGKGDTIRNIRPVIKNELNQAGVLNPGMINYIFDGAIDSFMNQCYKKISTLSPDDVDGLAA